MGSKNGERNPQPLLVAPGPVNDALSLKALILRLTALKFTVAFHCRKHGRTRFDCPILQSTNCTRMSGLPSVARLR